MRTNSRMPITKAPRCRGRATTPNRTQPPNPGAHDTASDFGGAARHTASRATPSTPRAEHVAGCTRTQRTRHGGEKLGPKSNRVD